MQIHPVRKLKGTVAGLFVASGRTFVTEPVETLSLSFEGIDGDIHAGATRRSGAREPWYPRGTEMRNERQLSVLSPEELAIVAERLEVDELKPQWVGANMTLDGIPGLTRLPPRTLLFFEGGVTLKVDGDNAPCRAAGRAIAGHIEGRDDIETGFPKHAKGLRGLVVWVEKPGQVTVGETVSVRVPEQWIYEA